MISKPSLPCISDSGNPYNSNQELLECTTCPPASMINIGLSQLKENRNKSDNLTVVDRRMKF